MTGSAEQIKAALRLLPHATCGFVSESYLSPHRVPQEALPAGFDGGRALGSAIYFMVTPEAEIRLHSIRSDQIYHHYRGDPLEVLLLYPDGSGAVRTLGDILAGSPPQLLIPGGTLHRSRVRGPLGYALLGTTAWPAVESPDVVQGDPAGLVERYPAMREAILDFTSAAGRGARSGS